MHLQHHVHTGICSANPDLAAKFHLHTYLHMMLFKYSQLLLLSLLFYSCNQTTHECPLLPNQASLLTIHNIVGYNQPQLTQSESIFTLLNPFLNRRRPGRSMQQESRTSNSIGRCNRTYGPLHSSAHTLLLTDQKIRKAASHPGVQF